MVQELHPYESFLKCHRNQLVASGVPVHLWPKLFDKLSKQIFDVATIVQLLNIEYENQRQKHEPVWSLQLITDIAKDNPEHIYLIDHAWTFRVNEAKQQLDQHPDLVNRMSGILGLDSENKDKQILIDEIFENMWRVCNTYSIGNASSVEERLPVWYVMDEIGCAVTHSDTPNFRVVPLLYLFDETAYSLLFPIENAVEGDFVTTDFAFGVKNEEEKAAVLLPWIAHNFTHISPKPEQPGPDYYLSGHIQETLPNIDVKPNQKQLYKVFSQYNFINTHLTDNRFMIVDNEDEADILWYTSHFKDFQKFSDETPDKYINQFPYEYVLTIKDLLSLICRKNDITAKHIPITYNLQTELVHFLSYSQSNPDLYWIVKPYNLARSLDTHITKNLDYIIRLRSTGPKIVQRYISNPVLFAYPNLEGQKVKFDVRFVLLLKSVQPLEAYAYKNFFLRFANKPFELCDFQDYERHFTVMNYSEDCELKVMKCQEFRGQWDQQYADFPWVSIEKRILKMLGDVFESAVEDLPPCGVAPSPQSRALYAADLMLEWDKTGEIQPKLLEINWLPDCQRACEYYPDFYNDIFSLLFLNEMRDVFVRI